MMVEPKEIRINSRELVPSLLFVFLSLILSILFPLAAPVLGTVLLVSGIYAYRHFTDVTPKTIAIAAITGGIMIVLIGVLILFFMQGNTVGISSIENYPGQTP